MPRCLSWLVVLLLGLLFSSNTPLNSLRKQYKMAVVSADALPALEKQLQQIKQPKPVELAYQGSMHALQAKYSNNPYTKVKLAKKAAATLNEAVEKEADNPEIRYLRLAFQHNTPEFLGLSNHVRTDLQWLRTYLATAEKRAEYRTLLPDLLGFLKQEGLISPVEFDAFSKIQQVSAKPQ